MLIQRTMVAAAGSGSTFTSRRCIAGETPSRTSSRPLIGHSLVVVDGDLAASGRPQADPGRSSPADHGNQWERPERSVYSGDHAGTDHN